MPEVLLSTVAAEYVAFSMAMREVLPMRALLKEVTAKMKLRCAEETLVRSTVFEDNQGCLSCQPGINIWHLSTISSGSISGDLKDG